MKKSGNNTVGVVTALVEPLIKEQNLILWDVRFEKEGSTWILRIIIDKEGGVSLNDCENLSRPFDKILDEADPIDQGYCLEVSSAGIERELTKQWHYDQCEGMQVQVKLIRPHISGEREFNGILLKHEDNTVGIKCGEEEYSFADNELAYVRLYVEF